VRGFPRISHDVGHDTLGWNKRLGGPNVPKEPRMETKTVPMSELSQIPTEGLGIENEANRFIRDAYEGA